MELTAVRPQGELATASGYGTGFLQRLWALPAGRKFTLAGGLAALVAIAISMVLWAQDANYKLLYANVSDKDAGDIIAQLSQMNVPYKFSDHGGAIMVPADKVHDVRLKLASAGLPKGSVVGLEMMENPKFGITQFQERLNFQRGLEGELVRSIQSLSAVQGARVHLAIPMQNGFFREQQKPSASVLLNLYPGQTLERSQIAGIVHLVASSLPDLSPKAVSVIDQTGTLLSGSTDGAQQSGLDAQQLQYVSQIEAGYAKRIADILEPMVGRDNLRAQVTAQVDFSQVESTSEQFKPNQGGLPAAVRSQQTSESVNGSSAQAIGIPGAASNQPPVPATAPINGASAPLQAAQGTGLAGGTQSHRDAVTNYEVDKTVMVTRNATGMVKRLNAAVVINNVTQTDAKGKTTTKPLTKEELDKLTALVRESIGFNEERGDSVKVINVPFKVEKLEPATSSLLKQPEVIDFLRMMVMPGAMTVLALIVIFGAIRPALKVVQETAPRQLEAVVGDNDALGARMLPALEAPANAQRLEEVRRIAKENPAAVANVVRNWVSGEA